jgi:hypothetical protein
MKKYLIILGSIIVIAAIGLLVFELTHFHVRGAKPQGKAKIGTLAVVEITYNRTLDESTKDRFSITPRIPGVVTVEGSKLIFRPSESYTLGTIYSVVVLQPTDQEGTVASDTRFSFTPQYLEFSRLSDKEQEEQIEQSDSLEKDYPVVKYLPQETLNYKLDYRLSNEDKIVLTIALYAIYNGEGQEAQYNEQLRAYKKEALDFLRSKGEDPNRYEIEYTPEEAKGF